MCEHTLMHTHAHTHDLLLPSSPGWGPFPPISPPCQLPSCCTKGLRVQEMVESRPSPALSPSLTHPSGSQGSGRWHLLGGHRDLWGSSHLPQAGMPQPPGLPTPHRVVWHGANFLSRAKE